MHSTARPRPLLLLLLLRQRPIHCLSVAACVVVVVVVLGAMLVAVPNSAASRLPALRRKADGPRQGC